MALIIGKKNPKLVQSEDIGNLARASYGKPEVGTAIGEQNDAKNEEEATELSAKLAEKQGSKEDNTDDLPSPEEDGNGDEKTQNNVGDTEPNKPKKGGRPKKS